MHEVPEHLKIRGVTNNSDVWGSILTCIQDAIDERIAQAEGDVVHTDWTEEDWDNYRHENCMIHNAEDFLDAFEVKNQWKHNPDQRDEFVEVVGQFFDILKTRLGFGTRRVD